MNAWAAFWTALAGIGGGFVGALATMWATNRTLRQQVDQSEEERARAAGDAFENAALRAGKQLLTAGSLLRLMEKPTLPFFAFDHDALDDLLSYSQLPTEVAFELERAALALRSYNAAASWENARHQMSGSGGPAVIRWQEARSLVNLASDSYKGWRGAAFATLHPLLGS